MLENGSSINKVNVNATSKIQKNSLRSNCKKMEKLNKNLAKRLLATHNGFEQPEVFCVSASSNVVVKNGVLP